MGKDSEISWTHHTFNPWWGCTRVSPGCKNCYAETFAHRWGLEIWGSSADRRYFGDKHWREPLAWNASAAKRGVRERVFCASMADVFESGRDRVAVELEHQREKLWGLIKATPHLDWLLLTKRPENMRRFAPPAWAERWPDNVWAGTTVEDQRRADERIPHLLRVPAAVRFLSCEPLLEAVDLSEYLTHDYQDTIADGQGPIETEHLIHWVICGGESGHGARPFDLAWARSLRDQCREAGAAFFFKQAGAKAVDSAAVDIVGLDGGVHYTTPPDHAWVAEARGRPGYRIEPHRLRLSDAKGGNLLELPEDLRIRQMPGGAS